MYVGEVDLCEVLSQYWCSKQCNLLQLNSSSYNPIPREGGGGANMQIFRQFSPEALIRGGFNYTQNSSFAII